MADEFPPSPEAVAADPPPPHPEEAPPRRPAGCLRTLFRLLLLLLLLLGVGLILALRHLAGLLEPLPAADPPRSVKVFEGDSAVRIAARMRERGLLRPDPASAYLFRALLRRRGIDESLKPGEYRFTGEVSLYDLVEAFARGTAEPVFRLTIPEGLPAADVAARLAASNLRDATRAVELLRDLDPARSGFAVDTVEGLLFPDTYHYGPATGTEQILDLMWKGFRATLPDDYGRILLERDLTLQEAVTLASIVEREARLPDERPTIAAVFLNRLRKGMRLESCATVMYALGGWRERLLIADTKIASPYNTYQNKGLPPTPICSPGRDALRAVFTAPETEYLYFVARGDGGHHFSKTFKEHQEAIRRVKAEQGARGRTR